MLHKNTNQTIIGTGIGSSHRKGLGLFQFLAFLSILSCHNSHHSNTDAFQFHPPPPSTAMCRRSNRSNCAAVATNRNRRRNHHHSPWILRGFLDGLFGSDGGQTATDKETAVLATHEILETDADDMALRFESLADYITNKWLDLFVSKTISLTTPITASKTETTTIGNDNDEEEPELVLASAGCKLLFQKVDTGYETKDDDEDKRDDEDAETEGPRQGGVEILVQKLQRTKTPTQQSLRVVARRCEVDEDTMIKEMSEEIIVKELQKAIRIWKQESL